MALWNRWITIQHRSFCFRLMQTIYRYIDERCRLSPLNVRIEYRIETYYLKPLCYRCPSIGQCSRQKTANVSQNHTTNCKKSQTDSTLSLKFHNISLLKVGVECRITILLCRAAVLVSQRSRPSHPPLPENRYWFDDILEVAWYKSQTAVSELYKYTSLIHNSNHSIDIKVMIW